MACVGTLGSHGWGKGFLISQFFSAFSAAFIKKYSQSRNAMLLSGYQFLCGGLLLWTGGRCLGESPVPQASWKGWLVLLYLALVSALAYSIWSYLLKYNKMSKIGMYQCWIPLVGVIWSAVLLQEGSQAFSSFTLFALVLVVLGIGCVNKEETS
ncbi:DMT family transporter [uncultured Dubosiella sp.]|uniref:DMT family transporter n=1 Tax=uncultured Dubosiella sp. TaxID=1937011 RepID=UPI0027321645|nr:DMT family transporter [uncultured Dubosiella sp.]